MNQNEFDKMIEELKKTADPVKKKRIEATEYGIWSNRCEGYEYTPHQLEIFMKVAKGELTPEEADQIFIDELEQLRKEHPEYFIEE